MTPLFLALTLMAASPAPDDGGEPLPPGAPTDPYELSAWCYGALGEYLAIYDKVKPDLRDIDRMFGEPVKESEPYQSDMAAARAELKIIGASVTNAEKASDQPISELGVAAIKRGRDIWSVAETKTSRELARAWLTWALPDRCDTNARELTARSVLLGRALKYNAHDAASSAPAASTSDAAATEPASVKPDAAPASADNPAAPADAAPAPSDAPARSEASPETGSAAPPDPPGSAPPPSTP
jgi:hypothetical protein